MSNILFIREHQNGSIENFTFELSEDFEYYFIRRKRAERCKCIGIYRRNEAWHVESSCFIGVDWMTHKQAVYIAPKVNNDATQIDYLQMMFEALQHPEIGMYTEDLFEIKFEACPIEIPKEKDLLTPLLVVQFLSTVRALVRKGLKKTYYRVDQNLFARVKGKVLTGRTIKQNILKHRTLNTWCSFEEFGLNGLENRLLKKALLFIERYIASFKQLRNTTYITDSLQYILPAFTDVSDEIQDQEIRQAKPNVFFKEYQHAVKLAQLIIKRFGYNIQKASELDLVKTPPFWIDMSKLFELYVLKQLLERPDNNLVYQFQGNYGQPDYILPSNKLIIDAKYKTYYREPFTGQTQWKRNAIATDIRQLSGYSRDRKVLERLQQGIVSPVECVIIYPDLQAGFQSIKHVNLTEEAFAIAEYYQFYKIGVTLPCIKVDLS